MTVGADGHRGNATAIRSSSDFDTLALRNRKRLCYFPLFDSYSEYGSFFRSQEAKSMDCSLYAWFIFGV